MLLAIDRHRALLEKARSDSVGALDLLAPDRAGPELLVLKDRVVARLASPLHDDPLAVGKQNRAADAADREKAGRPKMLAR